MSLGGACYMIGEPWLLVIETPRSQTSLGYMNNKFSSEMLSDLFKITQQSWTRGIM